MKAGQTTETILVGTLRKFDMGILFQEPSEQKIDNSIPRKQFQFELHGTLILYLKIRLVPFQLKVWYRRDPNNLFAFPLITFESRSVDYLIGSKGPFVCFSNLKIQGQRGRCCFCAACPNRKMYLEIRGVDEGLFSLLRIL